MSSGLKSADGPAVRPRPGGRAARVVADVHRATMELLESVGYDRLQLIDVAERAQVNKTTVYRRWPTKSALVADLVATFTQTAVATPDTGSLINDLKVLLGDIADALRNPAIRAVLRGALAAAEDDAEVRAAQSAFWRERFERSGAIVARAIERGELRGDVDPRELLELAASPLYFRSLFTAETIDARYIDRLSAAAARTVTL